jgi:sigma-B regulation protein RsbQ
VITVDALHRHRVRVEGADHGPTILLAHGFGCGQQMWRYVAALLGTQHRVAVFDHAGSGDADPATWDPQRYASLQGYADDIAAIVDALDDDVVFVGHSVSAMMGVVAAIARPDLFRALVLLAPSPCYLNDGDYLGGFTRADIDELLESLENNYLGWSAAMAPTIMGHPDRPELSAELEESFCRTDPACAQVFARTTFLSDNRADLPRVPVPTLVVECARDAIAPRGVGAFVADRIPDSRLVTLDTDGHCPHLSAPEATAAAIAAFVDDLG